MARWKLGPEIRWILPRYKTPLESRQLCQSIIIVSACYGINFGLWIPRHSTVPRDMTMWSYKLKNCYFSREGHVIKFIATHCATDPARHGNRRYIICCYRTARTITHFTTRQVSVSVTWVSPCVVQNSWDAKIRTPGQLHSLDIPKLVGQWWTVCKQ